MRTQLRTHEPPETEQTYRRLRSDGYSERDAIELITAVLAAEIFGMFKQQVPHDPVRYATMLKRLPELPYDPDE